MKKKLTLIGFFIMMVFCFEAVTFQALALNLNPTPVPREDIALPNIYVPPSGERNVIIFIADDLGIDRLRQYIPITGNTPLDLPATPTIRRLRMSGVIFDNAWANPVCSPTRAGFLTGRHSFRTTVANAIPIGPDLPAAELTLPELISTAGYVSGLFGKWHLGGGVTGPNDQGFDWHQGVIEGSLPAYDSWVKYENGVQIDGNTTTPAIVDPVTQYATEANVQDAFDWIQTQTSNWLAVVAFNAPHTPMHTPTINCDGVASLVPDINGMIECIDQHIDWLLLQLESIGELEKTTIIFIGDNGTDSASILEPFNASPHPSHKMEVYEGGIRVPFIISDGYHLQHGTVAPASSGLGYISSPGRRENAMVHTVDIFATVAGIVGVVSTAQDSVSMLRYLATNFIPVPRQYMYTDRCSSSMFQAAIRDNQYKLIYRLDYNVLPLTSIQELYDVADLEEMNDLFGTGIAAEALLLSELNSMWASEWYDPLTGCP